MPTLLIAIFILAVLLLFTIFVLLYVSGLCQSIDVYCKPPPPCLAGGSRLAYKIHEGPYDETGYLFTETSNIAQDRLQLGVHFTGLSEPDSTERSAVGCLLQDEDHAELFQSADYRLVQLPPIEHVLIASFPHTSIFSIRLGSLRVYPRLRAYTEEHDLKLTGFLELYDGEYIHYIGLLGDEEVFRQLLITPAERKEETDAKDDVETLESSGLPSTTSGEEEKDTEAVEDDDDESEDSFEKITSIPEATAPAL